MAGGRERWKYASTRSAPRASGGFTSRSRVAPSAPATHAAMLSLVTSQVCGNGSAADIQSDGAITGILPA
jgi:hypothetical protein